MLLSPTTEIFKFINWNSFLQTMLGNSSDDFSNIFIYEDPDETYNIPYFHSEILFQLEWAKKLQRDISCY